MENTKEQVTEAVERNTESTTTTTTTTTNTEDRNVLLGTISYTNQDDYEKFLTNLDVNQALFVLITSANYGQTKGLFNLDESELIARAIKTIKRTSQEARTETETESN